MSRGILNGKNPQLFYFKGTSGMREAITLTLHNGVVMPMAGIGAFLLSPGEAEASCAGALAGGCRLPRQTCLFGLYRDLNLHERVLHPVNHIFIDNDLVGEPR